MEAYKKLNADLVQQLQEYKQKQRLFELQHMQSMQESLIQQRIIREQKVIIESFVRQNSQDLNSFLGHLVTGHQQNMTVVAEFVQNMLRKLETLLLHISSENPNQRPQQQPAPAAPTAAAAPPLQQLPSSVEIRRPRMHRSLSPVAVPEERQLPFDSGQPEANHEEEEVIPEERFITKRRRKYSPPPEETEAEPEPVAVIKMTPTDPITLPDGMLSTIAETSLDGRMDFTASLDPMPEVDEGQEEEEEEEENEQEQEQEDKENEMEEQEENPVQEDEAEGNKNNLSIHEDAIIASSTPNPTRRRVFNARVVLSPLDLNQEIAKKPATRRKRAATPVLRDLHKESVTAEEHDTSMSSRPRRRAAPKTLAEPSLRDKMRR